MMKLIKRKNERRSGFTLVELSLSIVFISILSITMVMIINNTIVTYRRGIVLSQINTVGMDIVDSIRGSIKDSPSTPPTDECALVGYEVSMENTCRADGAKNFVSVVRLAKVTVSGNEKTDVPVFGALCTGKYSYIWNSGYFMSSEYDVSTANGSELKPAVLKYRSVNSDDSVTFPSGDHVARLIRILDENRAVCVSAVLSANKNTKVYDVARVGRGSRIINNGSNVFDITSDKYPVLAEEPEEILLSEGKNNIAIYDMVASAASDDTGNSTLYSVSFVLGTIQGGVDIMTSNNFCATPTDYENENFDYCAINKFNFAAQANGG